MKEILLLSNQQMTVKLQQLPDVTWLPSRKSLLRMKRKTLWLQMTRLEKMDLGLQMETNDTKDGDDGGRDYCADGTINDEEKDSDAGDDDPGNSSDVQT